MAAAAWQVALAEKASLEEDSGAVKAQLVRAAAARWEEGPFGRTRQAGLAGLATAVARWVEGPLGRSEAGLEGLVAASGWVDMRKCRAAGEVAEALG